MLIVTKVFLAAVVGMTVMAASAGAQPPPDIPVPGQLPGPLERFQVTVNGGQHDHIKFAWDVSEGATCGPRSTGTLDEFWEYKRGTGIVLEFRKLGGHVVVSRADRPLGDAALAAPGTVMRRATGRYDSIGPSGCVSFPLATKDCGKAFPVRSQLRFGWSRGRLTLRDSGLAAQKKNPARACGSLTDSTADFGSELSYAYPILNRQYEDLSAKQLFGSKRSFHLQPVARFLKPLAPPSRYFTVFDEDFSGHTVVTFKRIA